MDSCHDKQDKSIERISYLSILPVEDSEDDQFESQLDDDYYENTPVKLC